MRILSNPNTNITHSRFLIDKKDGNANLWLGTDCETGTTYLCASIHGHRIMQEQIPPVLFDQLIELAEAPARSESTTQGPSEGSVGQTTPTSEGAKSPSDCTCYTVDSMKPCDNCLNRLNKYTLCLYRDCEHPAIPGFLWCDTHNPRVVETTH